jgi:cbb3-type cytochrome oxidase subunit 3
MQDLINSLLTYGWFIGIPLVFLAIVFYIMRPSARQRYRKDAEIPFRERKKPER